MKTILYEGYQEPGYPRTRYRYVKDKGWLIGYGVTVRGEVVIIGRKKHRYIICTNQYCIR